MRIVRSTIFNNPFSAEVCLPWVTNISFEFPQGPPCRSRRVVSCDGVDPPPSKATIPDPPTPPLACEKPAGFDGFATVCVFATGSKLAGIGGALVKAGSGGADPSPPATDSDGTLQPVDGKLPPSDRDPSPLPPVGNGKRPPRTCLRSPWL